MKKISRFLMLGLLICFVPIIIKSKEVIADLSGIPGGGKIDANQSIASIPPDNYAAVRMYVVETKTGNIVSSVRDFTKATDVSASSYLYLGNTKLKNTSATVGSSLLKTGYNSFLNIITAYEGIAFPQNPGGDSISKFFKDLENKSSNQDKKGIDSYQLQFLQKYLAVSEAVLKNMADNYKSLDYRVVVEPVYFYRVFNGRLALSATEGVQIINTNNYTKTMLLGTTYINKLAIDGMGEKEYRYMYLYRDCWDKMEQGLLTDKNIRNCRSVEWWIGEAVYNWSPLAVKTKINPIKDIPGETPQERAIREAKSKHIINGTEYKEYKDGNLPKFNLGSNRSSLSNIIRSNTSGVGIGFLYFEPKIEVKNCKVDPEKDLPNCCDDLDKPTLEKNLGKCCNAKAAKALPGYVSTCCKQIPTLTKSDLPACCADPRASNVAGYIPLCKDPDPIPEPNNCKYYVATKYPTNCTQNTKGLISDIDDWKCIFESQTYGGADFSNHYIEVNDNRYCKIFCRQDINYDFPSNSFTILAGKHFTVGSDNYGAARWSPVTISSTATCKVDNNNINTNLFREDWRKANDVMKDKWDLLQAEIAREKSVANSSIQPNSPSCGCIYKAFGWECCVRVAFNCGKLGCFPYCAAWNTTARYSLYTPSSSIYNKVDYKQGSYCSNTPRPTFNVPYFRQEYNQAVNTRDGFLTTLNKCVNYEYNHKFNPPLSIDYEEEKYGGKFNLKGTISDSKTTTLLNGGNPSIMSYVCNSEGSICVPDYTSVKYPNSYNLIHTSIRNVYYTLSDNLYRYVDKVTGNSSHPIPTTGNYTTINYSNLPIDFSRYPGRYDLDINFSNLGPNNKFNDFIVGGKGKTQKCDGYPNCKYVCNYGVSNIILGGNNPGNPNNEVIGLNVLFRPISLSNPFPGVSGQGRPTGSNWAGLTEKILNNRGVKAEEIYTKKKPIYEIVLDSRTISAIRKDNQNNSYTDFKLKCSTGTGKECISEFLTELKKDHGLKIDSCARDNNNKWVNTCMTK